ncbi:hypothetical protein U1Q18_051588 [Sarracenia purpurea var. burkii]
MASSWVFSSAQPAAQTSMSTVAADLAAVEAYKPDDDLLVPPSPADFAHLFGLPAPPPSARRRLPAAQPATSAEAPPPAPEQPVAAQRRRRPGVLDDDDTTTTDNAPSTRGDDASTAAAALPPSKKTRSSGGRNKEREQLLVATLETLEKLRADTEAANAKSQAETAELRAALAALQADYASHRRETTDQLHAALTTSTKAEASVIYHRQVAEARDFNLRDDIARLTARLEEATAAVSNDRVMADDVDDDNDDESHSVSTSDGDHDAQLARLQAENTELRMKNTHLVSQLQASALVVQETTPALREMIGDTQKHLVGVGRTNEELKEENRRLRALVDSLRNQPSIVAAIDALTSGQDHFPLCQTKGTRCTGRANAALTCCGMVASCFDCIIDIPSAAGHHTEWRCPFCRQPCAIVATTHNGKPIGKPASVLRIHS